MGYTEFLITTEDVVLSVSKSESNSKCEKYRGVSEEKR